MKIVVVEDELSIRNGLGGMLGKIGQEYELVGKAADGAAGLRLIEETRPDLVILDIEMPVMDGLTMLAKLRERQINCKVVVLTAYSDFDYAKKAIELGIDNYLLKPIKISELRKTLEIVKASLQREHSRENLISLVNIVRNSILERITIDDSLAQLTMERYGLRVEETMVLFSVWLGKDYEKAAGETERKLTEIGRHLKEIRYCIMLSERYQLLVMIMYRIQDHHALREHFEETVFPSLCDSKKGQKLIGTWAVSHGLIEMPEAFDRLLKERLWYLHFGTGVLISRYKIEQMEAAPFKYPIDLENQMKQAVVGQNEKLFEQSFHAFQALCRNGNYAPEEIRENCIRYSLAVLGMAKNTGVLEKTMSTQIILKRITEAFTWEELEQVLKEIYQNVQLKQEENPDVSLLVKRTKQMIEEYYNQGITLEEIAQKLCVSEEYLSTQFKKESGASFTETIRNYRIEKVKELLLSTNLKLNQIADMAGYTDPKYMSRVFREEVGMLPAEYRKIHG